MAAELLRRHMLAETALTVGFVSLGFVSRVGGVTPSGACASIARREFV
jgi:hypothetical protein